MSSAEKPLTAFVCSNKGYLDSRCPLEAPPGPRKSSVMMMIVAADRAPRAPCDAQDDERDGQADEGVGDRGAQRDDRGRGDDAQRYVGVGAGVVAVGDEGGAVQAPAGARADDRRHVVAG